MGLRYVWDKYNVIKDQITYSDSTTITFPAECGATYRCYYTTDWEVVDKSGTKYIRFNTYENLYADPGHGYTNYEDYMTFDPNTMIYEGFRWGGGEFDVALSDVLYSRYSARLQYRMFTDYTPEDPDAGDWEIDTQFRLTGVSRVLVSDVKSTLIGSISNSVETAYPSDAVSGDYWYTYKGSDSIDPISVSIPTSIDGGDRITISVTKSSTNTYGGTITYQYQISRNGSSSWTTLTSTTATSYNYTVPVGTTSIQARVKASDNMGFTSTTYVTSKKVTVHNNTAPSTPSSISVPSSVQAGKSFTVSWGASTDSDGNLSGYTLQRKLNSGSYTTIYTGSSRSYQDTIPKSGYTSVTYRVQAYDTDGATSSYRTSNTVTIINNVAPVISGSNQNLGVFTYNPPYIAYIITDSNNDTVTVTVKLDSSTLESRTVTLGQTYTVPINWWDIGTGTHTVTITANDGQGGTATRTYTFTKNSVGQISFNRLHKKTDSSYQTTYIETDSDSIITNNGQVLSERLSNIASKLSVSISTTPTEMVSRHRLHIKLTSEYTIDYLEMYSTNVKVGSSTLESILTQLESKVGISNTGTVPSNLNFERWRMKNSSGTYDIIYLEGVSEHIIRPCGKSVEESLQAIEAKF